MRLLRKVLCQRLNVILRPPDMVAGFVVPRFRQGGHGNDQGILQLFKLEGAFFDLILQDVVLLLQKRASLLQGEVGLHPGHENGRGNGLGDIINRPQFKPAGFVFVLAFRRKEDDRDAGCFRIRLQLAADLIPVHAGHHDVQQDKVGARLAESDLQGFLAVCRYLVVVVLPQQPAQQGDIFRRIVNDEYGLLSYG